MLLPEGYDIRATERNLLRMEEWLRMRPEVKRVSATMGATPPRYYLASGNTALRPNFGNLLVELHDRRRTEEVEEAFERFVTAEFPDVWLRSSLFKLSPVPDAAIEFGFIGEEIDMERKQWIRMESQFINRRILITKPELNGKRLGQLKLRKLYGINITRINRAGVDLVAKPGLTLQVGDRVNVVGTETAVSNVEKVLGNSMKRLNEPNLITIFIGIALGIVLGSIPITFPGIPPTG